MSNSRRVAYFFNNETKASTWEPPAELTEEQIKQLPGAKLLDSMPSDTAIPSKVRASHLLVKHSGSRRPSSWKEVGISGSDYPNININRVQPNITRSKEEAIEILRRYQDQINNAPERNQKFQELAKEHSDCSSHDAGGDLGWFGPGQMQKPFEDGAYALEVDQISDVISSDSGVHLIMRTG
jgi:NIMA-interacting peptidyl-prolyl cis-trans isomerase 1